MFKYCTMLSIKFFPKWYQEKQEQKLKIPYPNTDSAAFFSNF